MSHPLSTNDTPTSPHGIRSSPVLQGERIAFTGTLASMTHAEAFDLVARHGGTATEHVSRQTTLLVVGEEGWPLEDDGRPSIKLQQIDHWRELGFDIHVLNESHWLELLGLNERRDEVHRLYTPAMLSQILGISVHVIRGWERIGLIRPVKRVHRLPYFDFREVTSARRLSELLEAGISRKELQESLRRLPAVERGDDRPLEQLEVLAHHHRVIVRDRHGLLVPGTGQRLFDFDTSGPDSEVDEEPPPAAIQFSAPAEVESSPRDWLVEGCRQYDAGRLAEARDAFRQAAMDSPDSSDVHFQLGECLYRMGQSAAALERYYAAVEHDHDFLEAWTQIGCIHRELHDPQGARTAFEMAIALLPEYPDANFHLAETLLELGNPELARGYWEEYLRHDSRGPWADIARARLNPCDDE